MVNGDIPVIGDRGLKIIENIGVHLVGSFPGCTGCGVCEATCPEHALKLTGQRMNGFKVQIATDMCLGTACKKCQKACPQKVYRFRDLNIINSNQAIFDYKRVHHRVSWQGGSAHFSSPAGNVRSLIFLIVQ
jgi:ferredoxin